MYEDERMIVTHDGAHLAALADHEVAQIGRLGGDVRGPER